jgi:hypothetical protein
MSESKFDIATQLDGLFNQTQLRVKSASQYALNLKPNESLTADRILNLITNDANRTINLGGDLTIAKAFTAAGAFDTILRSTAATDVTLPTTGTLATLAGAETLTNKTFVAPALGTPISGNLSNCTGTGGSYTWIATETPVNRGSVVFTGLSSSFQAYDIYLENVLPVTDGDGLILRTSSNNGSSYDSGGSDYSWVYQYMVPGSSPIIGQVGSSADSSILIAGVTGNSANKGISGTIRILNPSASAQTSVDFDITFGNTNPRFGQLGYGFRLSSSAVNAVQLKFSGNIASGKIKIYGVKAA